MTGENNITVLGAKRVQISGNSKDWTVEDCLREALRAVIEDDDMKNVDMVFIAFRDFNREDGSSGYPSYAAGMSAIEAMGVLTQHITNLGLPRKDRE